MQGKFETTPNICVETDSPKCIFFLKGSMHKSTLLNHKFHICALHLGVLTIRGSYNQGSYNQGFLQSGVLTIRGLTIRVSSNQESYIQGFLQSMVQWFLQSGVLTIRGSYN